MRSLPVHGYSILIPHIAINGWLDINKYVYHISGILVGYTIGGYTH